MRVKEPFRSVRSSPHYSTYGNTPLEQARSSCVGALAVTVVDVTSAESRTVAASEEAL